MSAKAPRCRKIMDLSVHTITCAQHLKRRRSEVVVRAHGVVMPAYIALFVMQALLVARYRLALVGIAGSQAQPTPDNTS